VYIEAEDRVVVIAFHDARTSDAAIAQTYGENGSTSAPVPPRSVLWSPLRSIQRRSGEDLAGLVAEETRAWMQAEIEALVW